MDSRSAASSRIGGSSDVIGSSRAWNANEPSSQLSTRVSGIKALTRVLGWEEGSFEFHARLEPMTSEDPPVLLDAALLESTRDLDELRTLELSVLPPDATVRFQSMPVGPGGEEASKVEDAVLDLARGEFTIRRILDMIPDSDVEILRALTFLADLGSIVIIPR